MEAINLADRKRKVFVGMVKSTPGLLMMGEVALRQEKEVTLVNAVRVFEIQNENRIGYHFHVDPYFTVEKPVHIDLGDFLISRFEDDGDDKLVREYDEFLSKVRLQRSGLVRPDVRKLYQPEGQA